MHNPSISRRRFLSQLAAAAAASTSYAQPKQTPIEVKLSGGTVQGIESNSVRVFRGVPFAEPPVGPLRFLAPVAKRPWTGKTQATKFAPAAMQGSAIAESEDCLYLNLWVPPGRGPFPIFVWVHGGGYLGGRSSDPTFDGATFARDGILCITTAYRLGAFGFLDLEPALGAHYTGSANNGVRDVAEALTWVQANVSAFGGDPTRVTVGGESAGAKLVATLMGVPSAQALFHQTISESGGAERVWSSPAANKLGNSFAELWRKETQTDISQLLTASAEQIIRVQKVFVSSAPLRFPFRPEVDGVFLPRLPIQSISSGLTRNKSLLLGTNRDEGAPPRPQKPTANELANLSLSSFMDVYRRYSEVYPQSSSDWQHMQALTAEEYWIPSMRLLDAHVNAGGKAWNYRLDFTEEGGPSSHYAYHSLDLSLVWDAPKNNIANRPAEAKLAETVHAAWVAFIHGKAPAASGLPLWPSYSSDTRPTMIIDRQSQVREKPLEPELRLWDGVL